MHNSNTNSNSGIIRNSKDNVRNCDAMCVCINNENEEVAMNANKKIRMASAIIMAVALTVLAPSFVLAQDTTIVPATPTAQPTPAAPTDSAVAPATPAPAPQATIVKFFGFRALPLTIVKFATMGKGYFGRVGKNVEAAIKTYIAKKAKQDAMHGELDPFVNIGTGVMTALAPKPMEKTSADWQQFTLDRGKCDYGNPGSPECKALFDIDIALVQPIVDSITNEEDKALAIALLTGVSEYSKENAATGRKQNWADLDLFVQAALFSLDPMYWFGFIIDPNGGRRVTLDDIINLHDVSLAVFCPGDQPALGTLDGVTDNRSLELKLAPETPYTVPADKLPACRIFLIEGSGVGKLSDFDRAKLARDAGVQFEHWDILKECPESMDVLKGRDVAVYRKDAPTVAGKVTSVTADSFTIGEGQTALTVTCADIASGAVIVTLGPQTIPEGGGTVTLGMFGIGAEYLYGFGFGNDKLNDVFYQKLMIDAIWRPLISHGFTLNIHLGAGALFAGGSATYASAVPSTGDSWVFLGKAGVGALYKYKLLEVGVNGDFLFTGKGGLGGSGSLRIGVGWEHFALFAKAEMGFIDSGISAGDNPNVPESVKIDSIASPFAGVGLGIEVPF